LAIIASGGVAKEHADCAAVVPKFGFEAKLQVVERGLVPGEYDETFVVAPVLAVAQMSANQLQQALPALVVLGQGSSRGKAKVGELFIYGSDLGGKQGYPWFEPSSDGAGCQAASLLTFAVISGVLLGGELGSTDLSGFSRLRIPRSFLDAKPGIRKRVKDKRGVAY